MQLFQFLLAFTLITFASAIPQSPVGSSGSGDSSSSNTGPGDAVGSAAASSGKHDPLPFNPPPLKKPSLTLTVRWSSLVLYL